MSSQKSCTHPIIASIGQGEKIEKTYRSVSAVAASKNPAGSARRELVTTLWIGFECNIRTQTCF